MLHASPIITPLDYEGYRMAVLRLDLLHPAISGNKWYKLKYNLQQARNEGKDTILTFGGAFSNHIAATAAACHLQGFRSIGFIRGEAEARHNSTLTEAAARGMELIFLSRDDYRRKSDPEFLHELRERFPQAHIVPEGGDNDAGEQGCTEILTDGSASFTQIFCAYGTGATFRGIARSLASSQQLWGVNVLKYDAACGLPSAQILNQYHFGGYARHTPALLDFKTWFEARFHLPLDYVYTAKMAYAAFDLIRQGKFKKQESILLIHSGGLQGNTGYEARYNLNPSRQVKEPQG